MGSREQERSRQGHPVVPWHPTGGAGLGPLRQPAYHVGEDHAVADEEDGDVVADEVKVALPGVELDGEASRVPQGLRRAALVDHGAEPDDDGGLGAGGAQEVGAGQVADVVCHLEGQRGGSGRAGPTDRMRARTSKKPLAEAPRACTTRSGILSRSNWASFSASR